MCPGCKGLSFWCKDTLTEVFSPHYWHTQTPHDYIVWVEISNVYPDLQGDPGFYLGFFGVVLKVIGGGGDDTDKQMFANQPYVVVLAYISEMVI